MQHLAPVLVAWLATYLIHSTLLLATALVVARQVRAPGAREVLWKGALLGGIVTAGLHVGWGGNASVARLALPFATSAAPIALEVGGPDAPARMEPVDTASVDSGAEVGASGAEPPLRIVPVAEPTAALADAPWRWPELIAIGWGLLAALGLVALAVRRRRSLAPFARRVPVHDSEVRAAFRRVISEGGPSSRVRLTVCPGIGSPVAFAGGEICLPDRASRELRGPELEAMLAHELAHIERRDPAWSLAVHILERVFFFQPLNAIVRRRLMLDVELCCDDAAARKTGAPAELARCLASVAAWIELAPVPEIATGMANDHSALVSRVARLLEPRTDSVRGVRALALLGILGLGAAVGWAGPGVQPVGADAEAQDDEHEARLFRVVLERDGRGSAELRYTLGDFTTRDAASFHERLRALHGEHPGASFAIAPATNLLIDEAAPIVDTLIELGVAPVLVEGTGSVADATRAYIVEHATTEIEIHVVRPGSKLDLETGGPWSGKGRYRYGEDRLVGYRVGGREVRGRTVLATELEECRRAHPRGGLVIDARAGTVYDDVILVVDTAMEAGFRDIGFLGAYDEKRAPQLLWTTPEPLAPEPTPRVASNGSSLDSEVEALTASLEAKASQGDYRLDQDQRTFVLLEIDYDGEMRHGDEVLLDPAVEGKSEEPYAGIQSWLRRTAKEMSQAPLFGDKGPIAPSDVLELRVHGSAPMRHVQRVMESCGAHDVQVWKIELATKGSSKEPLRAWLPRDVPPAVEEGAEAFPTERIEVLIKVHEEGSKVRPDGRPWTEGDGPFVYDDSRELYYSVGPFRTKDLAQLQRRLQGLRPQHPDVDTVTIDARPGTTFGEVVKVLEVTQGLEFAETTFVGSYERSGF